MTITVGNLRDTAVFLRKQGFPESARKMKEAADEIEKYRRHEQRLRAIADEARANIPYDAGNDSANHIGSLITEVLDGN